MINVIPFYHQVVVERAAEQVPAGLVEDRAQAHGDEAGGQEQGGPGTDRVFKWNFITLQQSKRIDFKISSFIGS